MADVVRSWWTEPRAPGAPRRVTRDWFVSGAMVVAVAAEGSLRPDVPARAVSIVLGLLVAVALMFRRTHPLPSVLLAFGPVIAVDVISLATTRAQVGLYAVAAVLILAYALFRWGSGRERLGGLVVMGVAAGLGLALDYQGVVDSIAGCLVLLFPCVLGATVRYRSTARTREIDQVRLREREEFARELHDTVAHHVSAIAIRAQAGQVVATTDPAAAREALEVIEEEASRTLTEMRVMVGALREHEAEDRTPQRGIADLDALARTVAGPPLVEVVAEGQLVGLRPSVEAAVYRLAQESVTNALRHARHASRVEVRVTGTSEQVRLVVSDDGEVITRTRVPDGYGLLGMRERVALLGGSLAAGPGAVAGWTVVADLPRNGGRG
ncbi:histidine kinase [Mumia flava]|uniref:histidine kinase n=1 Tax=Mumia flava TaxID=1348852 RepID=A0A0B2BJR2_9ACTN|nr:histidine kinase [Mumia flava]PJJ56507.1 histidine kinase [Mumia flava]